MSLADWKSDLATHATGSSPVMSTSQPRPLHQIAKIREQQGISLRSAARRMQLDVSEVRALENEESDMLLSTLYRWQEALEVPVADLLVDQDDPLSAPVLQRARLIRLMKTAAAMREAAQTDQLRRMADMLAEQLVEIMPELKDVSPWHTVGQRRSLDEMGRCADQTVPDEWFFGAGS